MWVTVATCSDPLPQPSSEIVTGALEHPRVESPLGLPLPLQGASGSGAAERTCSAVPTWLLKVSSDLSVSSTHTGGAGKLGSRLSPVLNHGSSLILLWASVTCGWRQWPGDACSVWSSPPVWLEPWQSFARCCAQRFPEFLVGRASAIIQQIEQRPCTRSTWVQFPATPPPPWAPEPTLGVLLCAGPGVVPECRRLWPRNKNKTILLLNPPPL